MPVRRITAAGMCSPSGSAISLASARVVVVPLRAQPISRRCPRGAAAVAWQSTTSTSSCERDSETVDITLRSDETLDVVTVHVRSTAAERSTFALSSPRMWLLDLRFSQFLLLGLTGMLDNVLF